MIRVNNALLCCRLTMYSHLAIIYSLLLCVGALHLYSSPIPASEENDFPVEVPFGFAEPRPVEPYLEYKRGHYFGKRTLADDVMKRGGMKHFFGKRSSLELDELPEFSLDEEKRKHFFG